MTDSTAMMYTPSLLLIYGDDPDGDGITTMKKYKAINIDNDESYRCQQQQSHYQGKPFWVLH